MFSAQTTKKPLLLSLLLSVALLSQSSPVLAQQTMSAIPPRVDLTADPGQTITTEVKISNDTTSSMIYSVNIDDFIVSDDIGTPIPVVSTANSRWSLKSWVTAPQIIPVDAKSIQVIKLTFKVPLSAIPGGHYAMITYQPNPDIKSGDLHKTANLIGQRVGTLINLTVNGPITQNASVTKFSTDKFHEQGPITFTGSVLNLSGTHINAKGTITVYNPLNQKVAEIPVESGNVFPEISRKFSADWNQKWGYGQYRADLKLAYGTAGGVLTASILFWLFPIRLVIYSLVLIISVLAVIILLNKRNTKHQQELEKEVAELKEELKEIEDSHTSS